ncbi:preprotein translocase subunit SecA [Staphylococcus aureus]
MVLVRNINLALRAQYLFESNVDYFVYNGDIVLIDCRSYVYRELSCKLDFTKLLKRKKV